MFGFRTLPASPCAVNAPIIDLPNLRCLEFSNAVTGEEDDWIPLLAQIRAPRLENLGLQYDLDDDGRFAIGGQTIFAALVTWPSASTNRPEDAPLHSVLRNAGPSVACKVDFWTRAITVTAEGRGPGRLYIKLNNRPISNHEIPRGILTNLAPFGLPLDLSVYIPHGVPAELDFWDEVLDATPSLRTFALVSPVRTAREVMDRLSTKFPSSSSTNPRAPHLEKLSFRLEEDGSASFWVWSEGDVDVGETVKTMLDKRRDIFIQGGVINPPRLVVKAPSGRLFDEAEGRWLDWEPSDAAVPGAEPESGEGFMWEIWESFQEW
ncbi:hypothetical protein FRC04_004196 [Tulasnella sp. 424]|nr:hypothetical protein FRC04_004196 [Tulasnella sp. 424]KAG8964030.1 hypothetical protein FRC05_004314 [Tulasnella sp. 425]